MRASHAIRGRTMRAVGVGFVALVAAALTPAAAARAQTRGAPLPPLPPPTPPTPASDQPAASGPAAGSAPGPAQNAPPSPAAPPDASSTGDEPPVPGIPPPPPALVYVAPPPGSAGLSIEHETPHAPSNALWLGARLGVLAYGGALYVDDLDTGAEVTTGDFIKPGAALEVDVGARLARHYVPYVAFELGLAAAGRRFDGTDTRTSTTFAGIGFRYVAGDIDSVAFVSELSFGFRSFRASSDSGSYSLTGFEPFRLGLGAEIRLTSRFTISPLITFSQGVLTDTSGNIAFATRQPDGLAGPAFAGNGTIPDFAQTTYYAFVLGCGAHFDLIGR